LKLKIKNFRGIKEGSVDLAKFNVILGNSGKSTILEALYLLQNPLNKTIYEANPLAVVSRRHDLLKSFTDSEKASARNLFYNYVEDEASISLEISSDVRTIMMQKVNKGHGIGIHYYYPEMKFREDVDLISYPIDNLNTPISANSKITTLNFPIKNEPLFFLHDALPKIFDYIMENWIILTNKGVTAKVAEEISKFAPETFIDFINEQFTDYVNTLFAYTKERRRIRVDDLGNGIKEYIAVRMLYELLRPDFILWDDAETFMDPRMFANIAEWLTGTGATVVLTTHSLEFAEIMLDVARDVLNDENAKAILISLSGGILKSRTFTYQELEDLKKAGVDVRLGEGLLV